MLNIQRNRHGQKIALQIMRKKWLKKNSKHILNTSILYFCHSCSSRTTWRYLVYTLLHTTVKRKKKELAAARTYTHTQRSVYFSPLLTARSATLVPLRVCRILLRTTNVMFVMRREMASADMVNEWLAAESYTRAGRSVYGLVLCGSAGGCRKPQAPRRPLRSTFGRRWVASNVNM